MWVYFYYFFNRHSEWILLIRDCLAELELKKFLLDVNLKISI